MVHWYFETSILYQKCVEYNCILNPEHIVIFSLHFTAIEAATSNQITPNRSFSTFSCVRILLERESA